MLRAVILSATIAALVTIWRDQPSPVKTVQVAYCPVDVLFGAKDELGRIVKFWGKAYRPCSELDRYENA